MLIRPSPSKAGAFGVIIERAHDVRALKDDETLTVARFRLEPIGAMD
jgi:hypothetical protein